MIDRSLNHLHPIFREKAERLTSLLADADLPFQLFEGFRSPGRQRELYAKGRTRPGPIVTRAKPWRSYHQYGVAADFVLFVDDQWSWDDSGNRARLWDGLRQLAESIDLEVLSWEKPHVQLKGLTINDLLASGAYPPGGDGSWTENLTQSIYAWSGEPMAPPAPENDNDRIAIPLAHGPFLVIREDLKLSEIDWHSRYGGREWRVGRLGVFTRDHEAGAAPWRTRGEPVTCRTMLDLYGDEILTAARRHEVPIPLIMMVIATESAFARGHGFTGPLTFRWEPHVKVTDVSPESYGDYSAGPMQTLATTARWVIRSGDLDYDPFVVAPYYSRRPEAPAEHPLYEAATNIDIGTAEIRRRWHRTGPDPILVAAAYNSGGLYKSSQNSWQLRCHGDHLDRAAKWYGDACAVIAERME